MRIFYDSKILAQKIAVVLLPSPSFCSISMYSSNPKEVDGQPAWTPRISSTLAGTYASVCISSNRWPGAFAFALGKKFDNIYVGWGHKYTPDPYRCVCGVCMCVVVGRGACFIYIYIYKSFKQCSTTHSFLYSILRLAYNKYKSTYQTLYDVCIYMYIQSASASSSGK